ncbi:ATP-grasp domain-containing protein [Aeromicrobium sp.]|uniref:ATP-grasp domain-containing protein n=1 Tax=Aeromicrobium sp. TaxID=1871063 RepID=UPI003C56307D
MPWRKKADTGPMVIDDPQLLDSAPSLAAVERFVREVMPTVPGGRHLSTDHRGHRALIRDAAHDRGLISKVHGRTVDFYDGALKVGGMKGWVPSLVTREAWVVCKFKDMTKQVLEAAGLPTPAGVSLDADQIDEALAYLGASRGPLVLKPTVGSGGDGITCGITTEHELRAAWDAAAISMSAEPKTTVPRLVLEDFIDGVDIRVFVVGDHVAAAATRINCHVVGDGRQSIAELVDEKMEWRQRHGTLLNHDMEVDHGLLARSGLTTQDVPADDEVVVLNGRANVHLGGEKVDVTDLMHPELRQLAIDAVRAVPGLGVAGVDLFAPDVRSPDDVVVLELNVGANLRIHNAPTYGYPRNPAVDMVDEMIATAKRA